MDEPITEPDASEILDSEGLLVLQHLFSDDHDDLESVEALPTNPDVDDSSSSSDDDESGDDDDDDNGAPAREAHQRSTMGNKIW